MSNLFFTNSAMKNFFLLLILRLFRLIRKPHFHHELQKKYLIVSTTALGDTIWATPAIQSLKESDPNCFIAVLTSSIGKEVLADNPLINQIFVLKKSAFLSFITLYSPMKKGYFHTAFIFHASQRSILPFCYFLHIPNIIGNSGMNKGLDLLLSQKIAKTNIHEVSRRLELIRPTSANITPKKLQFFFTEKDQHNMQTLLDKHNINNTTLLIALHPGLLMHSNSGILSALLG